MIPHNNVQKQACIFCYSAPIEAINAEENESSEMANKMKEAVKLYSTGLFDGGCTCSLPIANAPNIRRSNMLKSTKVWLVAISMISE